MAAVTVRSDFVVQENKIYHCFHLFSFICHEVMDAMMLVFCMLNFKPAFSLSFFTLIKSLFSSSLLSAIRMVSSACLRLLIFLLAIWFKTGKWACQDGILSPCFFDLYAGYIMRNARLDESQAGIRIAGRNVAFPLYLTFASAQLIFILLPPPFPKWWEMDLYWPYHSQKLQKSELMISDTNSDAPGYKCQRQLLEVKCTCH